MRSAATRERRNIGVLLTVSLVSGFGGTAMSVAAGVWVMDLTGSAPLASIAGLAVFLPTLFGPLLGPLVDRADRLRLLVSVHLAMALCLLGLLGVRSASQLGLLYGVMLAYGVLYVVVDAAEAAIFPAALHRDTLGRVNGYRTSAQESVKLIAPLVGAGLYAATGGASVAVVSAVALAVSAALYGFVRLREPLARPERRRLLAAVRRGFRFLRDDTPLRLVLAIAATALAMSGLTSAATFAVVDEDLGLPAAFIGVLSSAQGAGAVVGGMLVGRLINRRGETFVAILGAVAFAAGTALRLVPEPPWVIAGSVLIGVGLPWTVVAAITAMQVRTPAGILGGVAATVNTLVFGPIAIAIPAGAAAITAVDHRVVLAFAAIVAATVAIISGRGSQRRRWIEPGGEGDGAALGGGDL